MILSINSVIYAFCCENLLSSYVLQISEDQPSTSTTVEIVSEFLSIE